MTKSISEIFESSVIRDIYVKVALTINNVNTVVSN